MDSYQVALYEIYARLLMVRQVIRNDSCKIAIKGELEEWSKTMGEVGTMVELKDDQLRACTDPNIHLLLDMSYDLTEKIFDFVEKNDLDIEVLRSLAPKNPEDI